MGELLGHIWIHDRVFIEVVRSPCCELLRIRWLRLLLVAV
jgi:hypothetical protein